MHGMRAYYTKGFTLIELLVVIAIIGVLASIVVVATGQSREKSRNAQILQQVDQYSKALELYYSDNRRYPNGHSSANNFRERAYCIGDTYTGTPAQCIPTAGTPASAVSLGVVPGLQSGNITSHVETALVPTYISVLQNFTVSKGGQTYSSPAYSACNQTGATCNAGFQEYSLWFVLEGTNQNCGKAQVINTALPGNNFTLCRLGNNS